MPYAIRVITGREAGRIHPLFDNGKIVLGHDPTCGILVADKYVSRFHCQIVVKEGKCVLTDLKSRNGTFVDAQRVTHCELGFGSHIRIGETLLRLEIVG